MPGMNAVLRSWHTMLGRDMHIPWPPGAPAPAPAPVPYVTLAMMSGMIPMLTSKMTPSSFADGASPIMVRGTDIGPFIPHAGPPSTTLPIEMMTSGSKSHFGVTKWKVKDQNGGSGCVAVGVLGLTNVNLNCGTPAPLPVGLVIAPTTHLAALTLGDLLSGLCMMAWDYVLQRLMYVVGNAIAEWVFPRVLYVAERLGVGVLGRTAARQMARALGRRSNIGPVAKMLQAERIAALAKAAERITVGLGLAAGSPLGISTSTLSPITGDTTESAYDRFGDAVDPQGGADALGSAVDDYFSSPSPTVTDVPNTPEADGGVPDATTSGDSADAAGDDGPGDAGQGGDSPSSSSSSVDEGDAGSSSTQSTPPSSTSSDPSSASATDGEANACTPDPGSDDADGNRSR